MTTHRTDTRFPTLSKTSLRKFLHGSSLDRTKFQWVSSSFTKASSTLTGKARIFRHCCFFSLEKLNLASIKFYLIELNSLVNYIKFDSIA